jgi:hypothetical protein
MHKNATKYSKTQSKWCKNKHGASKIIDMFETYHKHPKFLQFPYNRPYIVPRAPPTTPPLDLLLDVSLPPLPPAWTAVAADPPCQRSSGAAGTASTPWGSGPHRRWPGAAARVAIPGLGCGWQQPSLSSMQWRARRSIVDLGTHLDPLFAAFCHWLRGWEASAEPNCTEIQHGCECREVRHPSKTMLSHQ